MPALRNLVPLASVAVLTLVTALPFGWPADVRAYLPLLPYTVIHYWAVRRPTLMPEWGVFLAGLATDVLTHGPLGFWSLIFLLGVVVVDATRDLPDWGAVGRWGQFCGTLMVLGLGQWLVASIYLVEWVSWRPIGLAVAVAAFSYPLVGYALRPLLRFVGREQDTGLSRPGSRGGDNPTMARGQPLRSQSRDQSWDQTWDQPWDQSRDQTTLLAKAAASRGA